MAIKLKKFLQGRASRTLVIAVTIATLLFLMLGQQDNEPILSPHMATPPPPVADTLNTPEAELARPVKPAKCATSEMKHLAKSDLGLTDSVVYSRRCIKPMASSSVERNFVANITDSFFKTKTELDLTSCEPVQLDNCDPLPLHVHDAYPQTTYPHMVFGVSTSFERFKESVGPFAFWLAGSQSKFIGVVSDHDKHPEFAILETIFRDAGIDAKFVKPTHPELSVSQSHFTMIRDMVAASGPETQWFGLLDDDTFFPSLYRLSDALSRFDHTKHAYVGALSEDFRAVRGFGYMAFGGAGIFLSAALARDLEPLIETCLREARHMEGDGLIRDCTYHHSKAKLTMLPGLQQMDISKDASGFYEGGTDPISVHHWKSWYEAPVTKMSTAVRVCGDCFLQRWRLGEDTVFTNGYSIAIYPDGTKNLDLSTMESTWNPGDGAYDYSIGPLRTKMEPTQKKQYKLADAEFLDNGRLRQIYVYKSRAPETKDEVVELIWEPSKAGVLMNMPS
ncbi:hypothetical protein F5X68DRAFT_157853 [Plectosphaerella plurivora]|uniref:Glycosyltransferase family 31 protein n=1 Tax=Plectosphaerella plurivora TaxID=936078 RepID=A0A9P9A790_9PEZI|nr:hypothetical protein F5X68DRAFT_157853 [Plectosphaerella plurivora]